MATFFDYPDWQRIVSQMQPDPVASLFPYSGASPISGAAAFVGVWPSLQYFFQPATVPQRIRLQYFADQAMTIPTGEWRQDVDAGVDAGFVARNLGPWVSYQILRNGAGTITGNLYVVPSSRISAGNVVNRLPFLVSAVAINVLAGTSQTFNGAFGYAGNALFTYTTGAVNFVVEIDALDIAGTSTRFVSYAQGDAPDQSVSIIVPPQRIRVKLTNSDATDKLMSGVIVPLELG